MTGNDDRPALWGSDRAAEQITVGGGSATAIVAQPGDKTLPVASASRYEPGRGRRQGIAVSAWCPEPDCRLVTVHRFPPGAAVEGSPRRGSCGHEYRIKVRNTYRPVTPSTGAA